MSRAMWVMVTSALVLAATGCGIDVIGVAPAGPDGGAPAVDAAQNAPDSGAPAPVLPSGCVCELVAPDGWSHVAFAPDRSAPCAGDLTTLELVTAPVAKANACTCGACTFALPSCEGTYGSRLDDSSSPQCNNTSAVTHSTNGGRCETDNGFFASVGHVRAIAPPPTGATTCTSAGSPAADGASSTPVRACASRAGGTTCLCDAALAPAYTTCLQHLGDVECPSAAPKKRVVGTRAEATCGPCACTATATCAGSVTFYRNNDCTDPMVTFNTEQCLTKAGGGNYSSLKWTGSAVPVCTPTPPAGGAVLIEPQTICCP